MNAYQRLALAVGAAGLSISGCTVTVQPPAAVVAPGPVIVTDPVPPPPVIDQYYFWGGHYYYWHPDRQAYVRFDGHPPPERIVTVRDLPPHRH